MWLGCHQGLPVNSRWKSSAVQTRPAESNSAKAAERRASQCSTSSGASSDPLNVRTDTPGIGTGVVPDSNLFWSRNRLDTWPISGKTEQGTLSAKLS